MIAYGIGILPLIKNLTWDIHNFTQPWYADDARDLGTFAILETYFDSLTRQGPGWGYHPQPTKSVLIVRPGILRREKCSGHDTDLGCAQAHVILGVTLGTIIQNAVG